VTSKTRTVDYLFWNDGYIRKLSYTREKTLYLWLFTNRYITNAGIVVTDIETISSETGIGISAIRKILRRFQSDNKIIKRKNTIWVVNYIKRNGYTSQSVLININKSLIKVDPIIANIIYELYPKLKDISPVLIPINKKGAMAYLKKLRAKSNITSAFRKDEEYGKEHVTVARELNDITSSHLEGFQKEFPEIDVQKEFERWELHLQNKGKHPRNYLASFKSWLVSPFQKVMLNGNGNKFVREYSWQEAVDYSAKSSYTMEELFDMIRVDTDPGTGEKKAIFRKKDKIGGK